MAFFVVFLVPKRLPLVAGFDFDPCERCLSGIQYRLHPLDDLVRQIHKRAVFNLQQLLFNLNERRKIALPQQILAHRDVLKLEKRLRVRAALE